MEIDLVGHEGGNNEGESCFTPTVTDIATGWTVNRSVRNKLQKWVFEAIQQEPSSPPLLRKLPGPAFRPLTLVRNGERSLEENPFSKRQHRKGRGTKASEATAAKPRCGRRPVGSHPGPVSSKGGASCSEQPSPQPTSTTAWATS